MSRCHCPQGQDPGQLQEQGGVPPLSSWAAFPTAAARDPPASQVESMNQSVIKYVPLITQIQGYIEFGLQYFVRMTTRTSR